MRLLVFILFLTSCSPKVINTSHLATEPITSLNDTDEVKLTINLTEDGYIITKVKRNHIMSIEAELNEVLKHYLDMFTNLGRREEFYEITKIQKTHSL